MTSALITLQGFDASVHNANQEQLDRENKPTGELLPIKVLRFKDLLSNISVNMIFTPEQFEQFAKQMDRDSNSGIIVPRGTPHLRSLKLNGD